MTQRRKLFHRIRLVYRRSSTLLKCVVLASIVLSAIALFAIRAGIIAEQEQEEDLRNQAAILEQETGELTEIISQLGTVEGIRYIATHELGLVDPESEFFNPSN